MEFIDIDGGAWSRIDRTIHFRAERLARSGAVPVMDADDIAQDLRLDLFRRAEQFDPGRASFATFADRVTAHRIATLATPTAQRRAEREMLSLDAPVKRADGSDRETLGDMLAASDALAGPGSAEHDCTVAMRHDVRRLLRALSPACSMVAVALAHMTPTEIARTLGLHRSTVYARITAIREAAAAMGLGEYVGARPTLAPARR
jgi:RNA polymerase sigma factor (sigma-70 family)